MSKSIKKSQTLLEFYTYQKDPKLSLRCAVKLYQTLTTTLYRRQDALLLVVILSQYIAIVHSLLGQGISALNKFLCLVVAPVPEISRKAGTPIIFRLQA
jgi:hypothetical protein